MIILLCIMLLSQYGRIFLIHSHLFQNKLVIHLNSYEKYKHRVRGTELATKQNV